MGELIQGGSLEREALMKLCPAGLVTIYPGVQITMSLENNAVFPCFIL
jgi:hypothetical protein